MGTGATFANDILKLLFQGVSIANIADNAAVSPLTNLFVSLHTADPSAGTQNTSEAAYTGYARQPVARTSGGWTISANQVTPVALIGFPAATGGSETETFAAIGTLVSGAGKVMFAGAITPALAVSNGVTPQLTTATTLTLS